MDNLKFKLVYSDWYSSNGKMFPFGNCIHPVIRDYINYVNLHNINIDYYDMLQYQQEKAIKFDHSELNTFFNRVFPNNIISIEQISDDDYTYIFPLEIKDTLNALNNQNKFTLDGETYTWYLKDIIPKKIVNYAKTGKVKILINIIHDPCYDHSNIRMFELEMNKLGIDGTDIIFLSGSKFKEYYSMYPESKIKIYNGHLFLQQYPVMMRDFPGIGCLGYHCEFVEEKDLSKDIIRPYKFLCCNRSMDKMQRSATAYLAVKHDLLSEGKFSFVQKIKKDRLISMINSLIKNPNIEYIEKIESLLPYELDTHFLNETEKTNFPTKNNKKEWYSETYINLVTETFFGTNVFLSEKIFKPISNLQPFIVIGDYKTLDELQKLGFKTFSPFIDESYDTEIDPRKRFEKIEIEIQKLKNKSIYEIHDWYYSIIDILVYNKQHLYNYYYGYECFIPILEQMQNDYKTITKH